MKFIVKKQKQNVRNKKDKLVKSMEKKISYSNSLVYRQRIRTTYLASFRTILHKKLTIAIKPPESRQQ